MPGPRKIFAAILLALFLAASSLPPAKTSAQSAQRKSVILLIADDQGLDLGCYGNTAIKTPNLDKLAGRGVRFTNAYATVASCSASRAVMLTGLYTHSNGQYGHAHDYHNLHLHKWVEPLPQLLKKNGYATGLIGKFHVNPAAQFGWDMLQEGAARDVYAMAQKAGEFFAQAKDKPFYLHVGFADPHRAAKGFANRPDYPGVQPIKYSPAQVRVPYHLPDKPEVREELAEHYEAISRLDQGVGLVLDALKAAGRDKDTLIIYLSDNGIPFPGAKTTLYDAGVRLPLIVYSPEQKKNGSVNHAMVSWVDLVPTILDWTGSKGPSYQLPGRSFLPILEEESPRGWDEVYVSHLFHEITMYYPMRGVRTRQFKYLVNLFPELEFPHASDLFGSPSWQGILKRKDRMMGERPVRAYLHRPAEELYDLNSDPNELKNVASDPKYAGALKDLRQRLLDWRKRTKDPWLILLQQNGQ